MFQDLRYGVRMLLKKPGFTVIAVLTLALGIGANAAVFSVLNAVLLRPLPFAEAQQLVLIWETHPNIPRVEAALPDLQDWRAQAQSFQELGAYSFKGYRNPVLTGQGDPVQLQGTLVSQNLFPLLGLNPLLGRNFLPEEEQSGDDRVVMLSYALWQRSFGGDPLIVGKSIQLNGNSFAVVGVLGEQYPLETDVWLPLSNLSEGDRTNRMYHAVAVIGRLKPTVTLEQVRSEMDTIAQRLQQAYPASNKTIGVEVLPLREQLVGNLRPAVLLVFAAVGLILLIACANVSNLLLAKGALRRKELAVRAALGAGRSRLVRQLLTESLTLALLGGSAGLALASWSVPVLRAVLPGILTGKTPGLETIGLDWRALTFTFGVTLLTGLLFGVLPALRISRINLNQALKEGGSSVVGRHNVSRALVLAEVALAVVVLVSAGLLVRSFQSLLRVDPGFRADDLLTLKINLTDTRYDKRGEVANFYQQLLARIEALPGAKQAAVIDRLPLGPSRAVTRFAAEGQQPEPGQFPIAQIRAVDQHFFELMQIPLRHGRLFDEADVVNQRNHVIINETLARRFFPQQNPVDRHILLRGGTDQLVPLPIIGVVADIKDLGVDAPVEPEIYWPGVGREAVLLVRTSGDPLTLAPAVRQAVWSVDSTQPVQQIGSVEETLSTSLARRRFAVKLLGALALLALTLAAIGIYGVVGYSVTQRTQEIGLRLALGAQRRDVFKLVIGLGIRPALLGLVIGLAGAWALTRLLTSLAAGWLFEVKANDPATFAATALLLAVVALLACYLPAQRATKVDPLTALRHE